MGVYGTFDSLGTKDKRHQMKKVFLIVLILFTYSCGTEDSNDDVYYSLFLEEDGTSFMILMEEDKLRE